MAYNGQLGNGKLLGFCHIHDRIHHLAHVFGIARGMLLVAQFIGELSHETGP